MTAPLTADICDNHPDARILTDRYISLGGTHHMAGVAVTVKLFEDNSRVREAVDEPGDGRVLVIDGGGSLRRAVVGGNIAELAAGNGWGGILVNGAVRDTLELQATPIAIHALGTAPRRTEKRGVGDRDVPVTFAGTTISPGHYVVADLDGVVVLDREPS